jgi:sugar lactone lactonase YvrE
MHARSACLLALALALAGLACKPTPPSTKPEPKVASEPANAAQVEELARLERMRSEDPQQGPARYHLARWYASQGDHARALELLRELLAIEQWDYVLPNHDFPWLAEDPEFLKLAEQARARAPKLEHGPVAFELDVLDILPEGVAWDPKRQELLVGSMGKREVLAATLDGKTRVVVGPAQDGLMGVLGVTVDATRDHVFVAAAAFPSMQGYDAKADEGRSAVYGFSLADGATLGSWPAPSLPSQLNDLVALPDGSVLVTDSATGAVLRKAPDAPAGAPLEPLAPAGAFFGPNGIATLPGNDAIAVADFLGLHRVSLSDGSVEPLPPPSGVLTLSGIDGLERHGSTLVAIQNVIGPGRVWAIELDADGRRLVSARILDDDHPRYRGPTTGAMAGDRFLYLADAFMQMGAGGMVPAPDGLRHAILELRLD